MLTRRETITAGAAASLAILAGVGISPADAETPPSNNAVDRELRLAISDGFTRQTWVHRDRIWGETRDTLVFLEDECIRITVHNDTPGWRTVAVAEDVPLLLLKAGQTGSLNVAFNRITPFKISVIGQPMISRPVTMRPKHDTRAQLI